MINTQFWLLLSSILRYSPISAWLKTTTAVNSRSLSNNVFLAVTPNPKGVSVDEKTMTPAYYGMFSVIFCIWAN